MKKVLSILLLALTAFSAAAQLTFNSPDKVIEVTPAASTGLQKIYVLRNSANVTATFTASDARTVNWYRFGASGAAYAEQVTPQTSGNVSSLTLSGEDMGLVIEQGTSRSYYWIVNYAKHPFSVSALEVSGDSDCSSAMLHPAGSGEQILFYTINGVPTELSREIQVSYRTLEYSEETADYKQVTQTSDFGHLTDLMRVQAPLCDTDFTLTGDRFLKEWGAVITVVSDNYAAIAVDAHTTAEQVGREVDNESRVDVDGLGGSAPVDITFTAAVTDAVRFTEWQFSRDPEFNSYDLRFNDTELTYTFTEAGITYVRFQASNNAGTCDWFSETYQVTVGESKLLCPNVFSPNGDGVNDIWKVSYRSIVDFDCTIFNRWGVEIIHFTDPSQGWDGKIGSKTAPSGVYYYVIKARGADSIKYELAGDINILNASTRPGASSGEEIQ